MVINQAVLPSNELEYPMGPYSLGFFAAITIESSDVVLDLNGKMLYSSNAMALRQASLGEGDVLTTIEIYA